VSPDIKYAKVRQGDSIYYLASALAGVLKDDEPVEVLSEISGKDMVGWTYTGPFDEVPAQKETVQEHRVVSWTDVSDVDGTGIVHIAPGCGKEDFDLSGVENLPVLAPIDESGNYVDGYGPLTGKNAAEVSSYVLDSLKEKGHYYKDELYSHSYPHCWRCDTPLLFRHVHEWFINMSWRDEIKEIVKKCTWIPEWGEARELDWLNNMRDWMISKKRYWGLALPIFECECGWFTILGSKDELREKAVAGWDEFDGHSPHRPWVDVVKIQCEKCGKEVSRIPDVGNPWLDAGIVPYSTVNYNTDKEYWQEWIPADLVLECFPGQFRNWFYALLSMSTMMENIQPFKTLLGHALVRDENGAEMHKSKGNAIWFDDAAEKMGVDVMRWVFCRQDPTSNLNFGYSVGKDLQRTTFNTWRNVYAFFCNYARLDEFDASREQVPISDRPDMDKWILSNLNLFLTHVNESLSAYDIVSTVRAAEAFIDRLSNWYVRRNRRRFWRARDESDLDKLAAYQTLHTVLVELCKAMAPIVPFMTETMYRNLVCSQDSSAPESVHLCSFADADEALIDRELSTQMDTAADLVSTVLSLRQSSGIRVRQPLTSVTVVCQKEGVAEALKRFESHVLDETNVKQLLTATEADTTPGENRAVHETPDVTVILDTELSDELVAEGMARDIVRRVQMLRKNHDLEMDDSIVLCYATESESLIGAIQTWTDYIKSETLSVEIRNTVDGEPDKAGKVCGEQISLKIQKA
jgi:isoleucyl-tRNA synthetase